MPVDELTGLVLALLGTDSAATLAADAIVATLSTAKPGLVDRLMESLLAAPARSCTTLAAHTDGEVSRLDATRVPGPVAVATAAVAACDAADRHGIGCAVVANVGALGSLWPYVAWGAARSLVTIVAVDGPPAVAPVGGSAAVIGTNPLAFGVPGDPPIVADFATADRTQFTTSAGEAGSPIGPRGGLIGTLGALLVEALTAAVSGLQPSWDGRTATVIAIRPANVAATTGLVETLRREFGEAGARLPGHTANSQPTDVEIRSEYLEQLRSNADQHSTQNGSSGASEPATLGHHQ